MPGPVPPASAASPGSKPGASGQLPGGRLKSAWKTGPDGKTVFRLIPPLVLWWVWAAFAAANIIDLAIQAHDYLAVEVTVGLLAVSGIFYVCTLRPRVVSDADGLTVYNPFRDYRVPWGAITGVYVGDSVEIGYRRPEPKPEKTLYAWALYSPRRARARSELRGSFGLGKARQRYDSRSPRRFEVPDASLGKMSQQAKELASKHPSHIMAGELARRRAEAERAGAAEGVVTARWDWLAIAVVLVPIAALIPLIITR
jgi:hypothetical protein